MKTRTPVTAGMILLFGILLLSCSMPKEKSTWTVASWNVQNLFDGVEDGSEYPEYSPSQGKWNENLYRIRLENTSQVILSLSSGGPDLVVLQEIENQNVLNDLATGPLAGRGYRWRFCTPGEGAIRCGVLSRYPVSEVNAHECGDWQGRPLRLLLSFYVHRSSVPVQVLAAHWKSPRDGRLETEMARRYEAGVAADVIARSLREDPNTPLMLIGDLNTPGDGEILPAALAPWTSVENGNEPDNRAASSGAVLYRCTDPVDIGIHRETPVLYDPEPNISRGAPGSYWFRESWDRPDRALISAGLVNGNHYTFLDIFCSNELVTGVFGYPLRWVSEYQSGYSDHLPLLLSFEVGKNR